MAKKRNWSSSKKSPKGAEAGSVTAIIQREGSGYTSLCPELDLASEGASIEDARNNLQEAVELFIETATSAELKARLRNETCVTNMQVAFG